MITLLVLILAFVVFIKDSIFRLMTSGLRLFFVIITFGQFGRKKQMTYVEKLSTKGTKEYNENRANLLHNIRVQRKIETERLRRELTGNYCCHPNFNCPPNCDGKPF
ncbi:MAG: hypothetical protein FWC80_00920 [Firmicutes bacterium]|nr:hypothetical protein [Bacillota bacterium]